MAYFAKVEGGTVTRVVVADEEFVNTLQDGSPGEWVETSYTGEVRKNYAGIGYTYDEDRDAFIPPQPYSSWVLDDDTCLWEAPVAYPDDGEMYKWNEATTSWDLVTEE